MNTRPLFWIKNEIKTDENAPISRVGGCLVYLPDQKKYILFGGEENTIGKYIQKAKESTLEQKKMEKPNAGTNSSQIPIKNTMQSIKEIQEEKARLQKLIHQIHFYNPEKDEWEVQTTKGNPPGLRSFFGYSFNAPYLLIHGGETYSLDKKAKNFSDIYILNVETLLWKRFFVLDAPSARSMHSLANINNEYYLYGGIGRIDDTVLCDLWMLSCDNVIWDSPMFEIPGAIWSKKLTYGDGPGPLKGHGSVAYDKNLVIFGGTDGKEYINYNLYFLDIESLEWSIPEIKGKPPEGRSYHSMEMINESTLAVFGGIRGDITDPHHTVFNDLFILDLNERQWICPKTGGTFPGKKFGLQFGSKYEDSLQIIIFGGITESNSLAKADAFVLSETDSTPDKNWHLTKETAEMREKKEIEELEQAEKKIVQQQRKMGDLEHNIRIVKGDMEGLEEELSRIKQDLSEKEIRIEKETQTWIKKMNESEIKRNQLEEMLEVCQETYANEDNYRKILQEKCITLLEAYGNLEMFILGLDKGTSMCFKYGDLEEELNQNEIDIDDIERERTKHRRDIQELKEFLTPIAEEEIELQDILDKNENIYNTGDPTINDKKEEAESVLTDPHDSEIQ